MAKKSKLSRPSPEKSELEETIEEETVEPGTEVNVPRPGVGRIDFYSLFGGIGIVLSIAMIVYLVLHYLLHIL